MNPSTVVARADQSDKKFLLVPTPSSSSAEADEYEEEEEAISNDECDVVTADDDTGDARCA